MGTGSFGSPESPRAVSGVVGPGKSSINVSKIHTIPWGCSYLAHVVTALPSHKLRYCHVCLKSTHRVGVSVRRQEITNI
jgi:hypothetical protein